ncbi:hypothetical protein TNCV_306901 [Trichonephila clavipes]|nr:hypothetical protein TNCV_306901 [Trichonephila clavipes]
MSAIYRRISHQCSLRLAYHHIKIQTPLVSEVILSSFHAAGVVSLFAISENYRFFPSPNLPDSRAFFAFLNAFLPNVFFLRFHCSFFLPSTCFFFLRSFFLPKEPFKHNARLYKHCVLFDLPHLLKMGSPKAIAVQHSATWLNKKGDMAVVKTGFKSLPLWLATCADNYSRVRGT